MEQPVNQQKLVNAFDAVTDSYEAAYPDSPFPELVRRYMKLMQEQLTLFNGLTTWEEYSAALRRGQEIEMELQYWNIDVQFAIIKCVYHEILVSRVAITRVRLQFQLLGDSNRLESFS